MSDQKVSWGGRMALSDTTVMLFRFFPGRPAVSTEILLFATRPAAYPESTPEILPATFDAPFDSASGSK